ncbi:WD40 repeat domain-containing protein, partial [Singulisphaera rosea]
TANTDTPGSSGDRLVIDQTGSSVPRVGAMTATQFSGFVDVTYSGFESIDVNLGDGSDIFTVNGTPAGPTLTQINSGGGSDELHVRAVGGKTTVNDPTDARNSADALYVDFTNPGTLTGSPFGDNLVFTVGKVVVSDISGSTTPVDWAYRNGRVYVGAIEVFNTIDTPTVFNGGGSLQDSLTVEDTVPALQNINVDGARVQIAEGANVLSFNNIRTFDGFNYITQVTGLAGVNSIAFSPDGLSLAASFADGKVRLWDLKSVQTEGIQPPSRVLEGNHTALRRVAFSPDGRSLSASDRSGTVITWKLTAPETWPVIPGPVWESNLHGPSASADASRFAAPFQSNGGSTEVKAWDAAGKVFFVARDETITDGRSSTSRTATLDASGDRLAYCAIDDAKGWASRLRVWEIESGKELFHLDSDRSGHFYSSTLSHDGRLLAASWIARQDDSELSPSRVYLWDLSTGRERLRLDVPYWADLAFSPDGRHLAGALIAGAIDEFESEIRVCDTTTGEIVLSRKWPEDWISTPTFSRDGRMLAVQVGPRGEPGTVKLLEVSSGKELHSLDGHRYNGVLSLAFSPDGRRLASASYSRDHADAEVKLWDVSDGRELLTLPAIGQGRLAFSVDGHRLSYVSDVGERHDARVQTWDATPLTDTPTPP